MHHRHKIPDFAPFGDVALHVVEFQGFLAELLSNLAVEIASNLGYSSIGTIMQGTVVKQVDETKCKGIDKDPAFLSYGAPFCVVSLGNPYHDTLKAALEYPS
jgi:hypothetical protein